MGITRSGNCPAGEIAIYANPEGHEHLFRMDLESQRVRSLMSSTANDRAPSVSPDSRHVAFTSDRNGRSDLYVLEVGSGDVVRLTTGLKVTARASWSRDGDRTRECGTGVDEVYVINRDGSGLMRPTHGTDGIR